MKILKVILITVAVGIMLFFGIALLLPSNVQVERTLVIPASAEIIFNQVNDLRQWQHWSPWHATDPDMEIVYEGGLKGEGASYQWKSDKVGSGKLTITESRPFEYIATEMDFMEHGTATGYYQFELVGAGTQVTWGFEADMGNDPVGKYMGLMMDTMIGSDFEKGLNNLKAHVQNLPANDIMSDESSSKIDS